MVSRQTVSDLLHEKKSVTAEIAIRIARAVGGSPESWLRMQEALDLWVAEMKFKNIPNLHQEQWLPEKKKPHGLLPGAFVFWLLNLSSNRGPTC
jgi:plasmid maintenance system antidote protein VapI